MTDINKVAGERYPLKKRGNAEHYAAVWNKREGFISGYQYGREWVELGSEKMPEFDCLLFLTDGERLTHINYTAEWKGIYNYNDFLDGATHCMPIELPLPPTT